MRLAPRRIVRAAAVVSVISAFVTSSCARHGPSVSSVAVSLEKVGISPTLAGCVAAHAANADGGLDRRAREALVRDPGALPPDVDERVTKWAADCALAPSASGIGSTTTVRSR